MLCFCQLWDSSSLLFLLSPISLHVIHCTRYPCPGSGSREGDARAASVRKRLCQTQPAPNRAHSPSGSQAREWRRGRSGKGVSAPEQIHPWSPWRKPGWSRYPHCISIKEMLDICCRNYIPWRTAGREIFFHEGCRSMGSTNTGAEEKCEEQGVSKRNCHDQCYDSCLL